MHLIPYPDDYADRVLRGEEWDGELARSMDPAVFRWAIDFIKKTSGTGAVRQYDEEMASFVERMALGKGKAYAYFDARSSRCRTSVNLLAFSFTCFVRIGSRVISVGRKKALAARKEKLAIVSWTFYEEQQRAAESKKVPVFLYISTVFCAVFLALQIVLSESFDDLTVPEMALITSRIAENGEWYRLVTAVLFHENIAHFLLNILLLWWYGFYLERLHGSMNVAMVFIFSALGSTLGRAVFTPYGGMVGIKGGITGLMAWVTLMF